MYPPAAAGVAVGEVDSDFSVHDVDTLRQEQGGLKRVLRSHRAKFFAFLNVLNHRVPSSPSERNSWWTTVCCKVVDLATLPGRKALLAGAGAAAAWKYQLQFRPRLPPQQHFGFCHLTLSQAQDPAGETYAPRLQS